MNLADDRDEWVMVQAARGRPQLLEILVRRHASALLTFIHRMVGDRHRSEELFQDVFLSVWINRARYEFPRPFKPWLYTIALNKCRASFRRRSPPQPLGDGDPEPPAPDASPLETAVAGETAALVSRAVTELPPQQRAVVVLRIWHDLSYAEIAEVVGCTEATARSHMYHGLAALRQRLEPRLGEETGIRTDGK
jgi:RNA polymerase sigma-70 factor (ECF subfamily)